MEGPSGVDLEQVDIEADPDEQFEDHLGINEIIQGLTAYPNFQIDLLSQKRRGEAFAGQVFIDKIQSEIT